MAEEIIKKKESNSAEKERKTFVKRYWFWILLIIITFIACGLYIDLNFTEAKITTTDIKIFENGKESIEKSYNFETKYPFLKLVSNFLYSFAMALAIALFILKVIQEDEEKLKEEKNLQRDKTRKLEDNKLKKEISKNIFKGIFNRLIPEDIFDVLQNDIIKANVVRKKVRWVYDFSIDQEKEMIILKRNITYEIHNLSTDNHTELFSYTFSKTPYTSTEIKSLKWHDIEDKENTIIYFDTEEKIKNQLEHKLSENIDTVFTDIKIPKKKVRLINFISLEKHLGCTKFVRDTHFSNACSIGWELHVNYPEGYEFSIMCSFSGDLQIVIADETKKVYEYDGGILKGQGIEFVLSKKV